MQSVASPSANRTSSVSEAKVPAPSRTFARSVAPILAFVGATCATYAAPNWEKTVWQGESAWASTQSNVRAIISETRSRLIYLGAVDGSFNLLNAPAPQVHPSQNNPSPNQGGHRFWLGPQNQWIWPPPAEWEYAAAHDVMTQNGVLSLHHAQFDPQYPAITREYAWEGNRLRCTARWQDNGHAYFGIHVVAVDTPFAVTADLVKTKEVSAGLVVAQMVDPEGPIHLPHPSIQIDEAHATVRSGIKTVKLGFVPQPLTIERPHGWKLSVQPGQYADDSTTAPDHGYLSQIWVGEKTNDLAELEQLTPHLKGDASGRCSSTIFLEATPPTN